MRPTYDELVLQNDDSIEFEETFAWATDRDRSLELLFLVEMLTAGAF